MRLPRVHLFELEDLPWFPAVVRDLATDYLQFVQTALALHEPIVPLLRDALAASHSNEIVDLCTGGGGPVRELQLTLAAQGRPHRFTLTDRYPNLPAFQAAAASAGPDAITYSPDPVDARAVPPRLEGFRTLFNAFHHFAPRDAVAVLNDAAAAGQPIGVFEIPERTLRALAPFLFLTPIAVALTAPFMRPFRWRRLLFTYLIPLVPLTCWWDGIVSHLRAYTVDELADLAAQVTASQYAWRAGRVSIPRTPSHVTYLIGTPRGATPSGAISPD